MTSTSIGRNRIIQAASLLTAAAVGSNAWAQQGSRYYGHMWDGGWHGWFFGPLMMILLVALVVLGVVLLLRGSGDRGRAEPRGGQNAKTPLDILKERFARGEIDKDEYEERRRVLEE